MTAYIIGVLSAFLVVVVIGNRSYYAYMDHMWRKYPYRFKYIFDRRLARLVKEGKIPPEDTLSTADKVEV